MSPLTYDTFFSEGVTILTVFTIVRNRPLYTPFISPFLTGPCGKVLLAFGMLKKPFANLERWPLKRDLRVNAWTVAGNKRAHYREVAAVHDLLYSVIRGLRQRIQKQ